MKLQLEHHEIEKAVQDYVAAQGIKVEGKELTVKFSMTRTDGQKLVADLSIDDPKPAAAVKSVPKAATKIGSVGAVIRDAGKEVADPAKAAIDQALVKAKEAAEAKAADLAKAGQTDAAVDPEPAGASGGEAAEPAAETEVAAPVAEEAPAPTKATSLFG